MNILELIRQKGTETEILRRLETLKSATSMRYNEITRNGEYFSTYQKAITSFFDQVKLAGIKHPLVQQYSPVKCYILVTTDMGFMGGVNAKVIEKYNEITRENQDSTTRRVVLGEKGAKTLDDALIEYEFFQGLADEEKEIKAKVTEIKDYIISEALQQKLGLAQIIYPYSKSFYHQDIKVTTLLPCEAIESLSKPECETYRRRTLVDSSFNELAENLIGYWFESKLCEVFKDCKLAEYSARYIHLDGSVNRSKERLKQITKKIVGLQRMKQNQGILVSQSAAKLNRKRRLMRDKKEGFSMIPIVEF